MRKLILNLVLASLATLIATAAEARVKPETLSGEFFEGRNVSIRGKKLDAAVTLTTIDNQTFALTGTLNKKRTRLTIQLPLVSADSKIRLTFTDKDGSVTVNTIVFDDPTLANGGVDLFSNAPVLPADITTGIAAQGPAGVEGPEGPEGPPGPQGAPGTSPTSLSGSRIIGPVALANEVVFATQNNITTLPSLVAAGTTGVTTAFAGPVSAPEGFTGNLTGDATNFTGNLVGDITGTQGATVLSQSVLFGKTLPSHTAAAGVVATGDTLEVAVEKLDGNVLANDAELATNTTNIATNTTAIGSPTAANTANEIVKRDGSGNFAAGTITADLVGNVTGNITGNAPTATSAISFTGPLLGDITGTQAATVLAPSVLFAKQLEAGYASTTGAIAANTSLLDAIQILDGNVKDTVTKTTVNATAIGAIQSTITNIQTDITDAENDITALDTRLTTAEGNITANTTAAADAQADVDALSSIASVDVDGATTFAVASAIVELDDTAPGSVEAIDTITGASAGQRLVIVFSETVTINDDNTGAADTINIAVTPSQTFDAGDTLELVYVNGSWYEVSSSDN